MYIFSCFSIILEMSMTEIRQKLQIMAILETWPYYNIVCNLSLVGGSCGKRLMGLSGQTSKVN